MKIPASNPGPSLTVDLSGQAAGSTPPLVCCIIVNWNGWRDTVACLESLQKSSYQKLSVLVVDNGSRNDSVSRIREAHPWAEILETGANLGFAGGNNAGIRLALGRGAEYVWLLNNDTLVMPGTLSALVCTASTDPRIGEVGSVLFYAHDPKSVQAWGGGHVNLWTGRSAHYLEPPAHGEPDYLTAASVLLPAKALLEVGLLDEGYFMYFEDTDLSYRIRAAGWKLAIAADAVVLHKEGASSGGKSPKFDFYLSASGTRFLMEYAPLWPVALCIFVVDRALKRAMTFQWKRAQAVLAGIGSTSQEVSDRAAGHRA